MTSLSHQAVMRVINESYDIALAGKAESVSIVIVMDNKTTHASATYPIDKREDVCILHTHVAAMAQILLQGASKGTQYSDSVKNADDVADDEPVTK